MLNFIQKPSIELYPGVKVDKNTVLEYKNKNVEQRLENLVLHSVITVEGEGYKSIYNTTLYLKEGDVLIYEDEGRGYIKPVEEFVSIDEAIDDLTNIRGVGE